MTQEATMILVDNSDYMRNGDYFPSRLQAQSDAVSLICHTKRQRNAENSVGLISMINNELLCNLTCESSTIYNQLHLLQPSGNISFSSSLKVARMALHHRQPRQHKMRIVCFVGSPIIDDSKELTRLAKLFRKEKINVDIVNFGENEVNQEKLAEFVDSLNGKDGTGSHLVSISPGDVIHDSLISSPVIVGEDGLGLPGSGGLGMEYGMDGADDPDLLYALRVSMEDQRMRQEHEQNAASGNAPAVTTNLPAGSGTSEEAMLQQALALSMQMGNPGLGAMPMDIDLAAMSEEDQIAYALRMSLQQLNETNSNESTKNVESASNAAAMDLDNPVTEKPETTNTASAETVVPESTSTASNQNSTSMLDVIYDTDFLESVLQSLPGVDTQNEAVRKVISVLTKPQSKDQPEKKEESDDKP